MLEQLKLAFFWARQFNDEGLHVILMVLALIYIAVRSDEKKHRRLLLGYTVLFLFVYFFPPVVWFMTKFIGDTVYWRMLWMLPLPIIISYTLVKVYARTESKVKRALLLAGSVAVLALTGQVLYLENSPYEARANWEKVPSSPAAICNIINANRGSEDEWALLAAPEDMVIYIVMYDPSIRQIYGRKGKSRGPYIEKTVSATNTEEIDFKKFCKRLRKKKCNYVVLPDAIGRIDGMKEYGFEVIGQVGTYIVYKDMRWAP